MTKTSLVRRQPRTASVLATDPLFREFDRFFRGDLFRPLGLFDSWRGEELGDNRWMPAVDVREEDDAYVFSAELPGLTREEVNITVEDNVLTLSGERKFEDQQNGGNYHRIERTYGAFSRSFSLPGQVDSDKIAASFKDGLLTVTVPKTEQAKPRQIKIS